MIKADIIVRRVFLVLTILFIVFIMVASWTPGTINLGGERKPFAGIHSASEVFRPHNVRDVATNVLLYIPLGVFVALAFAGSRPRFLSPWLVAGFGVSLLMESVQMFVGRHPDAVDLVTNSFGHATGYWVIVVAVRLFGFNSQTLLGIGAGEVQDSKTRTVGAFRFIYIAIYSLVALLPFDVSVSLKKVYAQLFPADDGRIRLILDPMYHFGRWGDDGLKLTLELLGLIPVAILTAFLSGVRGRLNAFSPVLVCMAVAFCCELAQVFLMSRSTDIFMIPLAALAGLIGWGLVRVWFSLNDIDTVDSGGGDDARWKAIVLVMVGYAVVLLFVSVSPFKFETDPVTVAKKILHESNLLPFREHFGARSLGSAVDIVKEVGLFVPLGILVAFLLAEIRPALPRNQTILVTGVACGFFAVFTELSQAVSIGRYIDVTDIFLAGAGGLAGAVMLRLFRFRTE